MAVFPSEARGLCSAATCAGASVVWETANLTWFAMSQTGNSVIYSSSSSADSPSACETWGRHQCRQETPISLPTGSQGIGYRGSSSPTKRAGFVVSDPPEMLRSSESQPQHFQMTSLQTACTKSSFYFNRTVFWLESVSYAIFKLTLVSTLCAYLLYLL